MENGLNKKKEKKGDMNKKKGTGRKAAPFKILFFVLRVFCRTVNSR